MAESHHNLLKNADFFEFEIEFIAFTNSLADARKNACAIMLFHNIMNQLTDQHGFAAASPANDTGLTSPDHREQQINRLQPGNHNVCATKVAFNRLVDFLVNAFLALRLNGSAAVDRFAHHIDDATKKLFPNGNLEGAPRTAGNRITL